MTRTSAFQTAIRQLYLEHDGPPQTGAAVLEITAQLHENLVPGDMILTETLLIRLKETQARSATPSDAKSWTWFAVFSVSRIQTFTTGAPVPDEQTLL